jgi:hypothetical protein
VHYGEHIGSLDSFQPMRNSPLHIAAYGLLVDIYPTLFRSVFDVINVQIKKAPHMICTAPIFTFSSFDLIRRPVWPIL